MTWDEWVAENHLALTRDGTPFERLFVDEILRNVPNLSPESVSAQTPFDDLAGKTKFIDFTIEEGEFVRIALEVDGYDKTGRGKGQTRHEFHAWSHRELSMTAAGWVPLRFANGLIKREPEDLIKSIELQLKMRRRIEEAVNSDGEKAKAARVKARELRSAAEAAGKGGGAEKERLRKIRSQRQKSGSAFLSEADRERLQEVQGHIDELNEEILREKGLRQQAEGENRGMKIMGIAVVAVVVFALVAIFLLHDGGTDSGPSVAASGNDSEVSARCDSATPADELSDDDVGQLVAAKGEVAGTDRFEGDAPRIYLNLGDIYPRQDLAVLIWVEDEKNWTTPPEAKYDSREVAVAGRLEKFDGDLRIAANSPNDIAICS